MVSGNFNTKIANRLNGDDTIIKLPKIVRLNWNNCYGNLYYLTTSGNKITINCIFDLVLSKIDNINLSLPDEILCNVDRHRKPFLCEFFFTSTVTVLRGLPRIKFNFFKAHSEVIVSAFLRSERAQ